MTINSGGPAGVYRQLVGVHRRQVLGLLNPDLHEFLLRLLALLLLRHARVGCGNGQLSRQHNRREAPVTTDGPAQAGRRTRGPGQWGSGHMESIPHSL